MKEILESDKERIIDFIKINDLDYVIVDDGIIRFHIIAYDGIKLYIQIYNDIYILTKYDPSKDKVGGLPYENFQFNNLQTLLEQLKIYDDSLHKSFWTMTSNSIDIGFDNNNYIEDWYNEFKKDDFWNIEDTDNYTYLTYKNNNYKPELKSPFNTISEVSPINDVIFTRVDSLYFQIHPISCLDGNESYLLKLQCNNEEVLKEYINYLVSSKKGLRLLLDTIFKEMEKFKEQ